MSYFDDAAIRVATLLLTSSLLVAGCSSSSNSPALSEDDNVVSEIDSDATSTQGDANDGAVEDDIGNVEETSPSVANSDETGLNDATDESNVSTTEDSAIVIVPDPLIQNVTRVDFGITVPVYQSGALQVRLTWGDADVKAAWVGNELWSASLDLPTETEHTLTVTFLDNNGGIELASFEQAYRTGSNAAEMLNITAEQFNSEQWDADYDGTSNLDELIAGTDPMLNEDSLLEVRDEIEVFLGFITNNFESRIPEERPYSEYYEEQLTYHEGGRPPSGASHIIEINIDDNGNGTLSDSRLEGVGISPLRTSYTGTRTHSDNAIQWDGQLQTSQDFIDLYITTNSVNTTSIIDERTWSYEETYRHSYDTSDEESTVTTRQIDLIGEVIEGTTFCQPVYGTVESETTSPRDNNGPSIRTSITKEVDDQYWRFKNTVIGNESNETEYLVRELNSAFQCEFVEF